MKAERMTTSHGDISTHNPDSIVAMTGSRIGNDSSNSEDPLDRIVYPKLRKILNTDTIQNPRHLQNQANKPQTHLLVKKEIILQSKMGKLGEPILNLLYNDGWIKIRMRTRGICGRMEAIPRLLHRLMSWNCLIQPPLIPEQHLARLPLDKLIYYSRIKSKNIMIHSSPGL